MKKQAEDSWKSGGIGGRGSVKKQAEDSWKSGGIGYADNQLLQCCHVKENLVGFALLVQFAIAAVKISI